MRPFSFARVPSRILLVAAGVVLLAGAAGAQNSTCRNIQAELASLGPGDPVRTEQFARAVQQQRYELDRTVAYSRSIGCDRRRFLFFGSPPPPQCGAIASRIRRMRTNLRKLQAEADRASGAARRRRLTARFNAYCRGAPRPRRNFFERLFGLPPSQPAPPPGQGIPTTAQDEVPLGGSKAVCVRTCDGGFFPITYSATRSRLESLAQRCQALCPNAKTELFTYPLSGDIDQAVSIDGRPYAELPNAGKFRTKFDPTCTCKPPGESWAKALAGAERELGHESSGDITVTPERSAEMARPKRVAKSKAGHNRASRKHHTHGDDASADAESAGIGATSSTSGPTYGLSDGRIREEIGPNGVKKKVRIIGPML